MATITTFTTPTRFFVGFALGLVPAVVFAILGMRFLGHSYERASDEQILAAQRQHGGIYGSALRDDFYPYKIALYRATKPRIVAIGSSRTWELQQRGFRDSFASLGGPVRSLTDGEHFLADMKASGAMPEIVLFGLDYWWFNDRWDPDAPSSAFDDAKGDVESWLARPFRPAAWLDTRRVGLGDFIDVAVRDAPPIAPAPAYGVLARYDWLGFAPDGHYRYFGYAFEKMRGDTHFDFGVSQIRTGIGRYVFGAHPSEARIAQLRTLIRAFEAAGSRVITFMPPVSSAVLAENARQGANLAYVQETIDRLHAEGLVEYDFHDARRLGATDCEFVDAFHGGEVLYLRIVLAIAEDQASGLGPHVDADAVRALIEHARGKILVDGEAFAPRKEADFLGLGCAK